MLNLGKLYRQVYALICGRHPNVFPWHFQWLSTLYLHRSLSGLLPNLGGKVLDVGCGNKPYKSWFGDVIEYIGIDVTSGADVDIVIDSNKAWNITDEHFDVLLVTQVIEHVENLDLVLNEMSRVTKRGGVVIASFPFLYSLHGTPYDFRRFTHLGAVNLLSGFEVVSVGRQGGIGSTLVILFLNWVDASLSNAFVARAIRALIMPLFIIVSLCLNLFGVLLDKLDRTNAFYSNVLLIARKKV